MYFWRITKYNPDFRDNTGCFRADDWTSFWDIGKCINGKQLTVNDYLSIESLYINAIFAFMESLQVSELKIDGLEKDEDNIEPIQYQELYPEEMVELFKSVKDGCILSIREVEYMCRLLLREHLWCKLSYKKLFFIHFGYDYYMYFGSILECNDAIEEIKLSGLFVEQIQSPYL